MRILIVDDHNLFLQSVATLLRSQIPNAKIETFTEIKEVYSVVVSEVVDLVLSDIYIPNYQGKNLVELFVQNDVFVPILLISASNDVRLIKHYVDSGAAGFVHKSSNSTELLTAINSVLNDGSYLTKEMSEKLYYMAKVQEQYLSKRQNEVLRLLGEGMSNKDIGLKLGIKEATVKTHISSLFDFFDAKNRVDCIRKAESLGLLTNKK